MISNSAPNLFLLCDHEQVTSFLSLSLSPLAPSSLPFPLYHVVSTMDKSLDWTRVRILGLYTKLRCGM